MRDDNRCLVTASCSCSIFKQTAALHSYSKQWVLPYHDTFTLWKLFNTETLKCHKIIIDLRNLKLVAMWFSWVIFCNVFGNYKCEVKNWRISWTVTSCGIGLDQLSRRCNKHANYIHAVATIEAWNQPFANCCKRIAVSLWITSFDNQLATRLLTTSKWLAVNKLWAKFRSDYRQFTTATLAYLLAKQMRWINSINQSVPS